VALTLVSGQEDTWWSQQPRWRCPHTGRRGSRGSPARCSGTSPASSPQQRANTPSTWRTPTPPHSWQTEAQG